MTHPARRAERDAAQDKREVASGVHKHEAHMHKGETETKLRKGGFVPGLAAAARPDRYARGGKVKHKGKVIVNINAGGQDDPGKLQAAHQAGIQQGAMLGARAVAARMGGGAGGPPPGGPPGGGAPSPGPMMAPPGPPPGPPGPPMAPGAPGMMPRRPFAQGGNIQMMRRRDLKGRFLGGAV